MNHKLDTDTEVLFYEQEFYILSNFSSFKVNIWNREFMTSEHAYHWAKFPGGHKAHISSKIIQAKSAHDAFQIAQQYKSERVRYWDEIKLNIMYKILKAKVEQHPYVKHKLLQTGNRYLIEDSWRDDYWGWGPNKDGQNMLGLIWMNVRDEIRKGI